MAGLLYQIPAEKKKEGDEIMLTNKEHLIKPAEALRLCYQHGTNYSLNWADEFLKEWESEYPNKYKDDSYYRLLVLLAIAFDAGRIRGIREERKKHGRRGTLPA